MSAPGRPRREVARPPRPRRLLRSGGGEWTRERVAEAMRAWAGELGRAPRSYDWSPATAVKNVLGGWSAALRAAGLATARSSWTEPEVLDGLRAFAHEHGRPPTSGDLRDTRGTPYPPATAVIRTCGSLRAALEQLGWEPAWTPVADTEILNTLRAYAREHGRAPSARIWRREHRRPGASVIIRRHGSWSAALAAALGTSRR